MPQQQPTPDLVWLVESRNKIQSAMMKLYKCDNDDSQWQLLVGAAFSLWRAVFLTHSDEMRSGEITAQDGRDFLKTVIERNSIQFGDDYGMRRWSGGYYVNNARFRLKLDGSAFGRPLKELWEEAFETLEAKIDEIAARG